MQRNFKLRNDFNSLIPNAMTIIRWTLMVTMAMVLQQIKITDAAKFKGESCTTKNQPGICREWSECPVIKSLIESGQYTNREVVNCGFGVREELICCPNVNTNIDTGNTPATNTDKDGFVVATTTTPKPDFWVHLIKNTTTTTTTPISTISGTTQKPDFWLHLLTTTTTPKPTTTTTTTFKPLIVGNQRLNESSEFFDLNALLNSKHSGGRKSERQVTTTVPSTPINNVGFVGNGNAGNGNANGRGNVNSAGNNLNQWIFEEPGNNNFRGNGNIGRGQSNGRGQGNGWGRGRPGLGNQNRGFTFPGGNARPNQFFQEDVPPIFKPGRPVNTFMEQNIKPQNFNTNPTINFDSNINQSNNDVYNEQKHIENLIKVVFDTSNQSNKTLENPTETNIEKSIANVFNLSSQKTNTQTQKIHFGNNGQQAKPANPNPTTVWLSPQDTTTLSAEYAQIPKNQPQQQVAFQNPHMAGHPEIISVVEQQVNDNDLEAEPSTNFIQQPVVVETWSSTPSVSELQALSPVQVVYENLLNSGMDIVKSNEIQLQQQQFLPQPQVVVFHTAPIQNHQHFVQQTQQAEVFFQQALAQHPPFIQQPSQQLIDQPQQSESLMKETRSTPTTLQKLVQQPNDNNGLMPNIQSPPANALDPFKPFEFRPPPENEITFSDENNSLSPTTTQTVNDNGERPAARACRRIEKGLTASLTVHILGGIPADQGEFPHMVGLGYRPIGGDGRAQYDIRCGGTLIDKRFVLTAAHCVSERDNVPSIVRLGVVDFNDAEQMSRAVELKIKETYIHDNYTSRLSYNDIAILELEREVETSEYIYPTCLYMNEADPDPKVKLWVTGWGTINTTTRSVSNILLKAPLHTTPLENCNSRIVEYGLTRKIPEGIIRSQFCAEDKEQVKDACQGDSGGPLNLVVDESLRNYRLVGVVSTGFGCASSTPGLYTRVAAFLDFIERIVWPNGGD